MVASKRVFSHVEQASLLVSAQAIHVVLNYIALPGSVNRDHQENSRRAGLVFGPGEPELSHDTGLKCHGCHPWADGSRFSFVSFTD